MHIYFAKSLQPLKGLLSEEKELSKFEHLNPEKQQMGLNVWLVHAADRRRKQASTKIFELCPLKFDSHVFEFSHKITKGIFNELNLTLNAKYKLNRFFNMQESYLK